MSTTPPVCPYCGAAARIVTGGYVYPHRADLNDLRFWYCDAGHDAAYVGCHKRGRGGSDGTKPLGRLADAELRRAKSAAHRAFDPLWKDGVFESRKAAYSWLSKEMGVTEAHIGEFDTDQCKRVVRLSAARRLLAGGGQ